MESFGNIWVVVEHRQGRLSSITHELLSLGRELADQLDISLEAVLLGDGARDLADNLKTCDRVICGDHALLREPTAESYSLALVDLVEAWAPKAVLISLSNLSADLAGLLPAYLEAPYIHNCRDIEVRDGRLVATSVCYAGKIEATVEAVRQPCLFGIVPRSRLADPKVLGKTPPIKDVAVELPDSLQVRLVQYEQADKADIDLSSERVLVGIGRGLEVSDEVELAEKLAREIGGVVCGTRPVIDSGWIPRSRLVGRSGVAINPKLFIAVGISGAPEHVEGLVEPGIVLAINTDPDAPIFNVAHYGVVEDAIDVLPALLKAVQRRKIKNSAAG